MGKGAFAGVAFVVAFVFGAGSAAADGVRHVHQGYQGYDLRLPPERHVIEVVDGWGRFIINGMHFTPADPRCQPWTAGDRIAFLSGEMHGYCSTALIHNISRHETCEVTCGNRAFWY